MRCVYCGKEVKVSQEERTLQLRRIDDATDVKHKAMKDAVMEACTGGGKPSVMLDYKK